TVSPDDILVSIYDVKFCPYLKPDEDPVFAAVAGRKIYICKPVCKSSTSKTYDLEALRVIEDPDVCLQHTCSASIVPVLFDAYEHIQENVSLNSVAWSLDTDTDESLVCVAGSGSKRISIWNVVTGDLVRHLHGHGGVSVTSKDRDSDRADMEKDVNDLVISPASPHVLASCSADYSIRVWNLDPRYHKQPCAAILSGEGHRQAILSIDFHENGRWLLSGGQDTLVCLWSVPEISDENAGTDNPTVVVYPHFASSGMHSDYVDCVRFWGDMVMSKASTGNNIKVKRGEIILWKIEGFSSADDQPPDPPMPGQGHLTRSAFGGTFLRLLTFDMVAIEPFYMRFGLFKRPGQRPMLVMGNIRARYSFWDLQRFEERAAAGKESTTVTKDEKKRTSLARRILIKRIRARGNATLSTNERDQGSSDSKAQVPMRAPAPRPAHKHPSLAFVAMRNSAELALRNSKDLSLRNTTDLSLRNSTRPSTRTSTNPPPTKPPPPTSAAMPGPAPRNPAKGKGKATDPTAPRTHAMKNYIRHAAHKTTVVQCPVDFACRAVEWSPDGKWCVAVGDHGIMAIFGRWMPK
ncbi:WD40 repeat-like protein, partial [Aureobasidium pullulans]